MISYRIHEYICLRGPHSLVENSSLIGIDYTSCVALTDFTLWAPTIARSFPWVIIASLLRNLPRGVQRLTINICCENRCDLGLVEAEESSVWEDIRRWLSRLSNLTKLSFVVQHDGRYISMPEMGDYQVFNAHLRAIFERELSLPHKQGILSISSSVVSEFGSQD